MQMSFWPHSIVMVTAADREHAVFRYSWEEERRVRIWRLAPILPVDSFIPVQNSVNKFSYKRYDSNYNLSSLYPSFQFLRSQILASFEWSTSRMIFRLSYTSLFNALSILSYTLGLGRKCFELKWRLQSEDSSACFSSHILWCDPGISQWEWSYTVWKLA